MRQLSTLNQHSQVPIRFHKADFTQDGAVLTSRYDEYVNNKHAYLKQISTRQEYKKQKKNKIHKI